jgi:uncharacterized repeat protein (TIGR03806 family)
MMQFPYPVSSRFCAGVALAPLRDGRMQRLSLMLALGGWCCLVNSGSAQVNVSTFHNDNAHTGQNLNETVLTPDNVNTNTFGKLFSYSVDGYIYGQPLILSGVTVPGKGTHNVVFVVTEHDSVYGFDANDNSGANAEPLWQVSFIDPASGITTVPGADVASVDLSPEIGISSTPVIDASTGTIYVEAKTKENGNYLHRLHALDVRNGAEKFGGPVVITATVNGTGDGNDGMGHVPFNALRHLNRPGLVLHNGVVYVAFASHGDNGPFHGWLLGYNAQKLTQAAVYNTSPNGGMGGLWQGGCGPAVDPQGFMYVATGNGTFDVGFADPGNYSLGDSVVKLATTNGLAVADYFTPFNQEWLNSVDGDLGSSGPLILPDSVGSPEHPHLLLAAGKEGTIYLLDRDDLGQFNEESNSQIVQSLPQAILHGPYGSPAYFNNMVYYLGRDDVLKAYAISNGSISPAPVSQGSTVFGSPGATPSISASGTSNAIVWALQNNASAKSGPAVLHAYHANDLTVELYNSSMAGVRDLPGPAVKFTVPAIANGKVYVGGKYALTVFGNARFIHAPTIAPNGAMITNHIPVTLADATPNTTIYYTLDGSIPTKQSKAYLQPFTLKNAGIVKARAFRPGFLDSPIASATFLNSVSVGAGTGLTGTYYSDHYPWDPFGGLPTLTRLDATVDFDWGLTAPYSGISSDYFTVVWTGDVQPQFSEVYTFHTTTSDGVRLWVNGQLIIDQWNDQEAAEWSGDILLSAGTRYPIRMEYYESTEFAAAKLSWSSPSVAQTIIPANQLYPSNNLPPSVALILPKNGSTLKADSASVQITAEAADSDGFVRKVDFYSDNNLIGTVNTSPYTLTWTGVTPGSYSVTAMVTDDGGKVATSSPISLTIIANTGLPYGITNRPALATFLNMPPDASGHMPPLLSQTGVFSGTNGTATLTPVPGVIPYDVNVSFWSDAAVKTRWMAVPHVGANLTATEQIGFATNGEWTFPAGTVFVKHFELGTKESNPGIRRRLETRLLVCETNGSVYGVCYKWRPDNLDADLLSTSVSEEIPIFTAQGIRTQTWYYPSPSECLTCHTPGSGYVLGLNTRQINRQLTYPDSGQTDNQLRTFNSLGLFSPPIIDESAISQYPKLVSLTNTTATVEARARSWLDANCSQCHRPGGASHANFDARFDTPPAFQNIVNGPVVTSLGIPDARLIVPHSVAQSVLYQRMHSLDPALKMPPIGRNLIDSQAAAVLADWINGLPLGLPPPIIIPNGGSYIGSVLVTLKHPAPGALLRYSLEDTITETNSSIYTSPFLLNRTATVSVRASETGLSDSTTVKALFSVRPQAVFTPNVFVTNGFFQAQLSGFPGQTYLFQASTDFSNWISLSTNTASSGLFNLLDGDAAQFPHRFYRAVEQH